MSRRAYGRRDPDPAYQRPCQHCGASWDVRPIKVRPLRQPDAEPRTVHWCRRCATNPNRHIRFVPEPG